MRVLQTERILKMKLYKLGKTIDELVKNGFTVDEETGEFFGMDELDSLLEELGKKQETYIKIIKNKGAHIEVLEAQAEGIKAVMKEELERIQTEINRETREREYMIFRLDDSTNGENLKTDFGNLTHRKQTNVEIIDSAACDAWARKHHPELFVKQPDKFSKSEFNKLAKTSTDPALLSFAAISTIVKPYVK